MTLNQNKYIIRKATLADAPHVAHMMYTWLQDIANRPVIPADANRLLVTAFQMVADKNSTVIVAISMKHGHEKRIGMAYFAVQYNYITGEFMGIGSQIYVNPKYRGNTVAKELINCGEQMVKKQEPRITTLQVNTVAPKLFQRRGWIQEGATMIKRVV